MVGEVKKSSNTFKILAIKFFLTFGFTGLFPVMPGTVGSLLSLIIVFFLNFFFSYTVSQTIIAVGIVIFFFLGIYFSRIYAIPLFHKEDPPQIVVDEVVGIWVSTWLLGYTHMPDGGFNFYDLRLWIVAFLGFRFFDITKVGGIRRLEKISRGWGVMLDDLLAGLFVFVILQLYKLTIS